MRISDRLVGLLAAALLVGGIAPLTGQASFTVTDLGTLDDCSGFGCSSSANATNDHGDIVGTSYAPGYTASRAFLLRNGTMRDLGALSPDHNKVHAIDINNRGEIIGESDGDYAAHPVDFLWRDGLMTPLAGGSDIWTDVIDINNLGQIVGMWQGQAATWIEGAPVALDVGDASASGAHGINDNGDIVGWVFRSGLRQAVKWVGGVMHHLEPPTLPGCGGPSCVHETWAWTINAHGDVVGLASDHDNTVHLVTWVDDRAAVLPNPPGTLSAWPAMRGINDAGEVVGNVLVWWNGEQIYRPAVWTAGAAQLLPVLDPSFPSGWALGINNRSEIVGATASTPERGNEHAVQWSRTAVPPPQVSVAVEGPRTVWPPNGRHVPVTFSGTITGAFTRVTFELVDEYGERDEAGSVTVVDGVFTLPLHLHASRSGRDKDGRRYTVRVTATGLAGEHTAASADVIVTHDRHRVR